MDVSGMASAVRAMSSKQVVFRADASLDMGTGHIMRCLTLANALREMGYECHFICREHPGNLIEFIRAQGHHTYTLSCCLMMANSSSLNDEEAILAHANWLGSSQFEDAVACQQILEKIKPQLLVVDHYALDISWEELLSPFCKDLMAIDDLADRKHVCELLLDQNLGRKIVDYSELVPKNCKLLVGPHYALLRPEFSELRSYSLARRLKLGKQCRLLITMGGADKVNATESILNTLKKCKFAENSEITVVMGSTAPWRDRIKSIAAAMPLDIRVLVNVGNMAQLMADSDICIGAAGSTSWERCALGLPSILFCLADNQKSVIKALVKLDAAIAFDIEMLRKPDASFLAESLERIWQDKKSMVDKAAAVTDGAGCTRVLSYILRK